MTNIAVFASGTGSNFDALQSAIEAGELDATIVLLVCDQIDAAVIGKAKRKRIPVFVFQSKDYPSKQAYETEIVELCEQHKVALIVLAGYMRLVSHTLLDCYRHRIINIHPSLLPAFKGKDAIGQAIACRVKVMGVSVHYVDATIDGGEIIDQACFYVGNERSRKEIEAKIHQIEHQLYPRTIQKLLEESYEKACIG